MNSGSGAGAAAAEEDDADQEGPAAGQAASGVARSAQRRADHRAGGRPARRTALSTARSRTTPTGWHARARARPRAGGAPPTTRRAPRTATGHGARHSMNVTDGASASDASVTCRPGSMLSSVSRGSPALTKTDSSQASYPRLSSMVTSAYWSSTPARTLHRSSTWSTGRQLLAADVVHLDDLALGHVGEQVAVGRGAHAERDHERHRDGRHQPDGGARQPPAAVAPLVVRRPHAPGASS